MAHKVKCYYCQQFFDRDKEPTVQVMSRRYAHKLCAEKAKTHVEEVLDDKGQLEQCIVPYIYKDAFNYYYQIWLAQQKNQDFKIEEYHPEEIVIKIPRPERPIKKRQLFTFLDEGDDTIE